MKYTLSGICDCPRNDFVQYLFQPAHMSIWQQSLAGHEVLSEPTGVVGAKTRLIHKYGKRRVEMIETVEETDLPNRLTATYEAPGAWNRVVFRFSDAPSGGTKWTMDSEFRCTGMLRIMTKLFPGMFRRTTQKEMNSLKKYAEGKAKESHS